MTGIGGAVAIGMARHKAQMIAGGAVLLAFVLLLGWALRLDHLRGGWKDKYDVAVSEAGVVLYALRTASDNPALKWDGAAGQAFALGESNRVLKFEIREQNRRIDEIAQEAVRLRAEAAQLQAIADRAEAQRQAALRKLGDLSITPGTRSDCMVLLEEAEAALDLVYEAGL